MVHVLVLNRVLSSRLMFPNWLMLGFAISMPSQCPHAKMDYSLSPAHRANIRAEVLAPVTHVQELPATVRQCARHSRIARSSSLIRWSRFKQTYGR